MLRKNTRAAAAECPACGAPLLTAEERKVCKKPGRMAANACDPRQRPDSQLTKAFMRLHFEEHRMSLREVYLYHGYATSTLSRAAAKHGVALSPRAGSPATPRAGSPATQAPPPIPQPPKLAAALHAQVLPVPVLPPPMQDNALADNALALLARAALNV